MVKRKKKLFRQANVPLKTKSRLKVTFPIKEKRGKPYFQTPARASFNPDFAARLSVFVIGFSLFVIIVPKLVNLSHIRPSSTPQPAVESATTTREFVPVESTKTPPPTLSARAFIAQDLASGTVLAALNPRLRLLPASTTKIATALVALDNFQLDDVVTIGSSVGNGQVPELVPGEKITVENLLYAMLINSDNDAAFALAGFDPQGRGHFVNLMNQKVASIGLSNTHFVNPAGFDDPQQYTTVTDMARLGSFAMSQTIFSRIVGTRASEIYSADQKLHHPLSNLNQLLGEIPGVRGIKTGYTEEAGENLVTDVLRDNHELIFVVLGSNDRFGDTKQLVDWAFGNFTWQEASGSGVAAVPTNH